jgi:hypothetical protein
MYERTRGADLRDGAISAHPSNSSLGVSYSLARDRETIETHRERIFGCIIARS